MGIVTELLMRFMLNPRMAYSAHLVALMSGIFLMQLGVLWEDMDIPERWRLGLRGRDIYEPLLQRLLLRCSETNAL